MRLNRLEAHDRLEYLHKDQSETVAQGASDCMLRNPWSLKLQSKCPYIYIFAFAKTADDGVNRKLIWQPRLSKPEAQDNSFLFRALSHTDLLEIIWDIPAESMWTQYKKGNITECEFALSCIGLYKSNKAELEKPHPEDLPVETTSRWLKEAKEEFRAEMRQQDLREKYFMPETSVPYRPVSLLLP